MATHDALRQLVFEAFCHTTCPDEDDLFEYFDPDNELFVSRLKEYGGTWQGLLGFFETAEPRDANEVAEVFYFFSSDALVYFTPAYILFSLHPSNDLTGDGFYHVLETANHKSDDAYAARMRKVWATYDALQLRVLAVAATIHYVATEEAWWFADDVAAQYGQLSERESMRLWSRVVASGEPPQLLA